MFPSSCSLINQVFPPNHKSKSQNEFNLDISTCSMTQSEQDFLVTTVRQKKNSLSNWPFVVLRKMKFAQIQSIAFKVSKYLLWRADRNKRAGLGKNSTLPAFLLSKLFNKRAGWNFLFITWKIASRVETKSEKSKQACSSIRDFRVVY